MDANKEFSMDMKVQPLQIHSPSTIHDLPTELLIRVFYAATEFRYSYLTLTEAAQILLTISLVSGHWRTVILSIPKIWGRLINVVGFSKEQVQRFIARSKSAPIELFLDGGSRSQMTSSRLRGITDRLSYTLLELWRISYLVIRHFYISGDHFNRLHQSAPSLQLFSFEGNGPDPVRLPARLFNNDAPRLRSLRLSSAFIDFEHISYPSLMDLTLRDIRDPFAPSISTLITLLSNHPSLTSLHVSYAVSARFSGTHEWLPTISLTHLQELILADDCTPCANILTKISIPSGCNCTLRAGFDGNDGLQLLQSALSTLFSTRLRRDLKIALSGISLAFANTVLDGPPFPNPTFFFKLQWQASFEAFEDLQLPRDLFDTLPHANISDIECLRLSFSSINGRYAFDDVRLADTLCGWLENMTSVKHLILESSTMEAILDLFSNDVGEGGEVEGEETQLSFIFPSLQGLEVLSTQGEELDWGALTCFAEWRDDIRHPIRYVTVPKGEVDQLSWKDGSVLADLGIGINLN